MACFLGTHDREIDPTNEFISPKESLFFERLQFDNGIAHNITMPATSSKVSWKKNGPVAAQLFRDFYFGKFKDTTPVAEIHTCPNRPYNQLNLNTFYKHVRATKNRVQNYKSLGTGLDNEEFLLLIRLNEPPSKEDQAPTFENLDSKEEAEDDDSAYTLGDEDTEDEGEEDAFSLETALRNIDLNGGIKDVKIPIKKTKSTPKNPPMKTKASYRDPINMVYPDGKRILCLFEADGEIDKIEDVQRIEIHEASCKKVLRYTKTPKAKMDAEKLIGGVVTGPNKEKNEDIANLKAYLEERKKSVEAEVAENGDMWELRDELQLGFEVEPQMYDNLGNPIDDFLIDTDGDGLYWCFFWLKGIHAKAATPGKKKGRRVGLAAA